MSRKFLTAIDLSKNELQNAAVQNLPSAPAAPVKGQLYFNSTGGDNTLYWWDGTTWVPAKSSGTISFGAVVPETTFGGTSADGVATTAARSDHKHANPLHDAAAHSTIPINSLGGATGPIDMNGFKITEVGDPTAPTDAANKQYVDNAVAGLSWKDSVRATNTVNYPVGTGGLGTQDGITYAVGDRILLRGQTNQAENGIWIAALGAWTRATDADTGPELLGAAVYVEEGTVWGDTAWVMTTNAPITVGTTALTWAQFAGGGAVTAGAGMTQSGNTLNVIAADATMVVGADNIARAALTGDVTTAVNVTTIANDAVTNVKAADMPANTMKGNNTGATADPIDLTPAQVKVLLGYLAYSEAAGLFPRQFATGTTAGTATTFAHGLGGAGRDVQVQVYRNSTPWDVVEADITHPVAGTSVVTFAAAVTANEYRIVATGLIIP